MIHRLIRMVRKPLWPRIDANTFRNGGAGIFVEVGAACRNRVPNASWPRNISTIISTPVTIIDPTMPISGPRRTFFTSPLNDTMLTENRIEKAGQTMKLNVATVLNAGFAPAFATAA